MGWNKGEPVTTTRKCNEHGDYMTGTSYTFVDTFYTTDHSVPGSFFCQEAKFAHYLIVDIS